MGLSRLRAGQVAKIALLECTVLDLDHSPAPKVTLHQQRALRVSNVFKDHTAQPMQHFLGHVLQGSCVKTHQHHPQYVRLDTFRMLETKTAPPVHLAAPAPLRPYLLEPVILERSL
jgi:hypothetical protein